jgi:hypothetical protein
MKLRLRPAMALVGWHLISPIGEPAKPGVLPPKTPLSQWRNLGTFDSSDQCQKALSSLRASFEQDTQKEITVWRKQRDDSHVERALRAAAAQAVAERSLCIASDDTRLKKTPTESGLSWQLRNRTDSANLRPSTAIREQKGQSSATPLVASADALDNRERVSAAAHAATTSASPGAAVPTSVVTLPPTAGEPSTLGHSQPQPPLKAAHSSDLMKPVTIASAGNLTFWRMTPGGVIARSTDGAHWRPLNSGTTNDLVAGAAPSAEICWVVGRGGTVLRTTDGEQWQAIASPTDADLVSVVASDELSATVLASDGRQFTTHDGGLSWRLTGSAPGPIGKTM